MSSRIQTIIVVGSLAVLLGGCGWDKVRTMKQIEPTGTAFDKALYKNYVEVADSEVAEEDWGNAVTFAERAIASGSGKPVRPEETNARDLPKDKVSELNSARTRLVAALVRNGRTKAPEDAGRAQVMFDCWMEEQEENHQPKDIARCRAGFEAAMAKVDEAIKPKPKPKPKAKPAPKPAPMVAAKPMPLPGPYTVFFDFDSAELNAAAQSVLGSAAAVIKEVKPTRILLSGHADRAGAGSYNVRLSERRVYAVAAALLKARVSPSIINVSFFGEGKPRVATPDGKRERMNRRVEIIFKR